MESSDNKFLDQLLLCSWYGVTCADGKWNYEKGEFPAEIARFKKIQINVQGNKLSNLAEDMCKMKKWKGGLVVTFGCDAILCPRNTFYAQVIRENVDEECQPCPDGNISNHLVSDRCDPNATTDDSEVASSPTVIADPPIQYNPTKGRRSKTIKEQSRRGLGGATKAFIIMVGLAVSTIILYALWGAYVRRKESIKYSIWMDTVWRLPLTLWSIE